MGHVLWNTHRYVVAMEKPTPTPAPLVARGYFLGQEGNVGIKVVGNLKN